MKKSLKILGIVAGLGLMIIVILDRVPLKTTSAQAASLVITSGYQTITNLQIPTEFFIDNEPNADVTVTATGGTISNTNFIGNGRETGYFTPSPGFGGQAVITAVWGTGFSTAETATTTITVVSALTKPVITTTNNTQSVTMLYGTPYQAQTVSEDFRYTICWNGSSGGNFCMTTPWAADAIASDGSSGGVNYWEANTTSGGAWTDWFWPGYKDAMGPGSQVYVQSVEVRPLPAGYVGIEPNVNIELQEDDGGNLVGTQTGINDQYPNCDTVNFSYVDASNNNFLSEGTAFAPAAHATDCSGSSQTPDVMRVYIGGTLFSPTVATTTPPVTPINDGAQLVSDNIPATFNPSEVKTTGDDAKPLEITVQNTGHIYGKWFDYYQDETGVGGYVTTPDGTESGDCSGVVNSLYDCPDTSSPQGSSCTVNLDNWSQDYVLLHSSTSSFGVGNNPAMYSVKSSSTCTVGPASCSDPACTDQASCVAPGGVGYCTGGVGTCSQSATDQVSCETPPGSCSISACDNEVDCDDSAGTYDAGTGETSCGGVWTDGGCGGTWVPPGTGCDATWGPQYTLSAPPASISVAPGDTVEFPLSSLKAPGATGTYTENWQMNDSGGVPTSDVFGDVMSIPISVVSTSSTAITVDVNCSPSSISIGDTSQCSAVVTGPGSPSQAVSWSTDSGLIDSFGVFTPDAVGTATITATSQADPSVSGTATVTVGGIVTVHSFNSQLQTLPVTASWHFTSYPQQDPCGTGANSPCDNTISSVSTGMASGPYTICSQLGTDCQPSDPSMYTLNSVKELPIAARPASGANPLLSFGKNFLFPVANADPSFPLANPPVQSVTDSSPIANFIILWDPIADISLNPNPVSITATAGGAGATAPVTLTNDDAPGSELTWSATVNPSDAAWLSVSPSSSASQLAASSSDSLIVTANPISSLSAAGSPYTGTILFSGISVIDDKPVPFKTLTVKFTVNPSGEIFSTSTLTCGGSACPAPACTFSASPTSVIIPEQANLQYDCSNVTSCSITGGNISSPVVLSGNASDTVSGSTSVSPTSNSIYTISCSGPGGSTSPTATVNVGNSTLCESNPGGVNCPGH